MLQNYLKIAWRNLVKNKSYSLINLTGLTISVCVFLIIGLYITNEMSFDTHFVDSDRIYRIVQEETQEHKLSMASIPPGLGKAVTDLFPEVESITELGLPNKRLLTVEGEPYFVDNLISVDEQFFNVFSFEVIQGNVKSALETPGNIILTQSLARRIFGNKNPMGKVIDYENQRDVQVAAIVKDPPVNTHFTFDALKSLSTAQINDRNKDIRWQFFNAGFVYVKLKEGFSAIDFEKKLLAFEKKANKPEWMAGEFNLAVQPLTSIHLGPALGNEIAPQGNTSYLYLFASIGVILLALACINYMNLSSAKALQRFREVGVRKTFGAHKSQLIAQFLSESVLICFMTLPLAFVLAEATLPYINQLLGLKLSLTGSQYFLLLFLIPLIIFITGIISGSYSAFFLSSLKPRHALQNAQKNSGQIFLRSSLVVFQFATGILLIIATITIYAQLGYVQKKSLGFDKEHIITFSSGKLGEQYSTFKADLADESDIVAVTSGPPAGLGHKNYTISIKDPITQKETRVSSLNTDYEYAETLGLKLKRGRLFSREHPTDAENAIILTEEAARVLDFDEVSVGEFITFSGEEKQVIGIIKNYHNADLFSEIQPVVLTLNPGNNWTGMVRLSAGNIKAGLTAASAAWKSVLPNRPFEFNFLDERINRQYQKDQKLATLFSVFTLIAFLVACLGLFGLAAFSAQRRTKEIGIRKVLGATVTNIVRLLSKDFLKLVALGFLIAVPIAWYAMNQWLADFAYRIEIGAGIFLLAGVLALLIALVTVSWQSIRAALANPVDSLRSE